MDSSSKRTLSQLFITIINWRMKQDLIHEEDTTPWTVSHLSVVYCYILKLGSISSKFKLLISAGKLPSCEGSYDPSLPFTRKIVASFVQELQEVFVVPEIPQLYVQKKIEHLAAFINFLLQLLSRKTDLINSFEDRIEVVNKELQFLVTFLGDTSLLLVAELEQVQNLLAEFEAVANETGRLVYSFLFNTHEVFMATGIDYALAALLKYIDHLRDNIISFSFLVQNISRGANVIPKIGVVDSYFIVGSLIDDLEDLMNWENDHIVDVKGQIKLLHQGLKDIKLPRYSETQGLKETVMQIGNTAYEAEYLINSFLVGNAPHWYLTLRLPHIIHKINLMGTQLQEIKNNFGALDVAKDLSAQQSKRNDEVDDIIVGLEEEADLIRDQLLGGTKHLQIISILGMPGLGKTTLAKKLYNHHSVNYHFDRRLWCIVSQTYQMMTILTDILKSLGSGLKYKEESLGEQIYKCLKGRRYLIVFDDIWSSIVWDDLLRYLPDDGNGSRIVFTSRCKDVAPQGGIIHALRPLSNDECLKLLEKKVFHNESCPPQLLRIGRKIAADCNGLPLAVVVIAGILSTMDKEESTWEKVAGNLGAYIFSDQYNSVMPILSLSYNHLPHHLKPCFLYFGAFPEDKEIPVNKLKYLWIAEGFICREENKHRECTAEEYLMELIDRSLVIVAKRRSDGGAKSCIVHDLLRDLCLRIAEEENFLKWVGNENFIYTNHRRLCVHNMKQNPIAPREYLLPFSHHICSFLAFFMESLEHATNKKLLRVVNVPISGLENGDEIGAPILTRYLAMSVTFMPASIGRFVNLEFLNVNTMLSIAIHPVMLKMVKLRHLHITRARFHEDCCDNPQTNNLESFSNIEVHNQKDEKILKCSPRLRKLKCICNPFVDEQGTCRYPDLHFLTQLESLKLTRTLSRVTLLSRVGLYTNGNLSAREIHFPLNIRKLSLCGLRLPWEKMSVLGGLPNLQFLKLRDDAFVGERWDTRGGEFPQLRFLKLYRSNLVRWNLASSEHFPKLQKLLLHECFYLREIPGEIGEIETLQLIEVKSGGESMIESAIKIQEEQREMGNEELRVMIFRHTTDNQPHT